MFLHVGGSTDRMRVFALGAVGDSDEEQQTARQRVTENLASIQAERAQCYLASDRERLLAVIEASFGTVAPFNHLVREVLNARLLGLKEASRSAKAVKGRSGRGASVETDVVVV